MAKRFGLAALLLMLLGGCAGFHCAEHSENSHASGGCGLDQTF